MQCEECEIKDVCLEPCMEFASFEMALLDARQAFKELSLSEINEFIRGDL